MVEGHIKLFRKLKRSAYYKDAQYVLLWVHLLLSANWSAKRIKINGSDTFIDVLPGQFLTSRDALSKETGINSSKVERILNAFKSEQQIEQQSFTKYRVISIVNWPSYQCGEQQNEQQMNSKRTADEQQMNTDNNKKKEKNKNNSQFINPSLEEVTKYCLERNRAVNPKKWHDFYSSKGWMVGSNKMKDWKAAVRTWEKDEETPAWMESY